MKKIQTPKKFKVNGIPFSPPELPSLVKVKGFLDGLPGDELIDLKNLADKVSLSPNHLRDFVKSRLPDGYYTIYRGKLYFGNQKAIKGFLDVIQEN